MAYGIEKRALTYPFFGTPLHGHPSGGANRCSPLCRALVFRRLGSFLEIERLLRFELLFLDVVHKVLLWLIELATEFYYNDRRPSYEKLLSPLLRVGFIMRNPFGCRGFDPEQGVTSDVCPLGHMSEEQRCYGAKAPQPLRGRAILEEYRVARRLCTAEGTPHSSLLVLFSNSPFQKDTAL
jgi:hypothetical protein